MIQMELNSNDNSLQKLIDSPPDTLQVSTINESESSSRKKFLVVKHGESKSNRNSLVPEWDFGENSSSKSFISEDEKRNPRMMPTSFEDDDVFSDEILKEFNKNPRESEGQDTITSLSNNIYRKQLAKIRRKSSMRESNSVSSTDTTDAKRLSECENLPFSRISSLKSIFKSQESLLSRRSTKFFGSFSTLLEDSEKNMANLRNTANLTPTINSQLSSSSQNLNRLKRSPNELKASNEILKEASNQNTSKSDKVFDALQNVISNNENVDKELIDKFVSTFRILELQNQRKKDKAKRVCLFSELCVFFIVLILTFFFAKTVLSQISVIKNLYEIKNYEPSKNYTDANLANSTLNNSSKILKFLFN